MANLRSRGWIGILASAALLSCGGSSDEKKPPADPPGTITMNIDDGGRIFFEQEQCGSGAPSFQCSPGCIWSYTSIYFYKSNLNFAAVAVSDCSTYGLGGSSYSEFQIADVGTVAGLAEVTSKSPAGFTTTLAAQVGHGYVIRYTKNGGAPTYVRLYVDGWLTSSTTGGVIGVRTKYQTF